MLPVVTMYAPNRQWLSLDIVGDQTAQLLSNVIPKAVSEHAHSSACEQAGETLRFSCRILSTRSLGPARPLCPFTPRAGANGARKRGLAHGPRDDEL